MKFKNYPNFLVPIEVAIKLKEIGFDAYTQNKTTEDMLECSRVKDDSKIYCNSEVLKDNQSFCYNLFKGGIAIPTYEQAFDWFRSKGIVSWIEHDGERDEYYIKVTVDRFIRLMKCPKGYTDYNCAKKDLLNLLIKIYCEEKITKTNE